MIAGGLFTVNKTTFDYLGKYDMQMDIWVRFDSRFDSSFLIIYFKGWGKPRDIFSGMALRRRTRNNSMQSCRTCLPETVI